VHLVDLKGALSGYSSYSISKAALTMLTQQMAVELGPQIRVNAVAPGIIGEVRGFSEEQTQVLQQKIPAGRFGTPEELAEVVRFLVEGPAFVSGQVWAVDGGRSARR
jgi:pteridine reductase